MSRQTPPTNSARSVALFIIMIFAIAAGISTMIMLSGNTRLGLMVCGGSVVFNTLVFLVGGLIVAVNRRDEDVEA